MNTKKIQKVRHQIARYRRLGGVRGRMLERLAIQLGRKRHKRGKEPIWVSDILPSARPLSIPSHPGDLNRFTARTILDVLESDLEAIERLAEEGDPNA